MSYVEVAGMRVWHEIAGDGPPVVLLHGAFAGASSWSFQTSALVRAGYRVYVPERRAHAHTPDVDGPLTYSVRAAGAARVWAGMWPHNTHPLAVLARLNATVTRQHATAEPPIGPAGTTYPGPE